MTYPDPVTFKSEDSLWQMLAKGIKTWDERLNDVTDERILRLTRGHWEKKPMPGRLASWETDEKFVCFENKATGQVLQFRFRGLTFTRFAPGWCFIELGGLIGTYDNERDMVKK